jgi:hypothetical protein
MRVINCAAVSFAALHTATDSSGIGSVAVGLDGGATPPGRPGTRPLRGDSSQSPK